MTEREWYRRIGEYLHEERLRRGWTIYDVAAVVEMTPPTIGRWERGIDRMKARPYALLRAEGLVP